MPPQIFRPCPLKCSDIVPSDIETLPPQMFRPCPIRFQTLPPPCTVIVYHGHQAHLKVKLTRNHTITALPKADGQMEAKTQQTKSSSSPSRTNGVHTSWKNISSYELFRLRLIALPEYQS